MSDRTEANIERLSEQFQRLCEDQPNVGHRLSHAKTKFAEAMYWLRANHIVHQDLLAHDADLAGGPRS